MKKETKLTYFITGILIALATALFSMLLTQLPLLNNVGALAIAIFLAVLYRHFFGYPEPFKAGLEFSAKRLLKFAIILYGLKLNISVIFDEGWQLILMSAGVIIFCIVVMFLLSVLLKGDKNISTLLGFGTGVCGAAAIAATSSIIQSKEKDAAISVGIIALVGTIFALIYSFLYNVIDLSPTSYAVWTGMSLHEVANVALAGFPAGDEALSLAILAKLSRVLLLIPLCFILIAIMIKKYGSKHQNNAIEIPYFLFGFIIMSLINTFFNIPEGILNAIDQLTSLLLIMAMVGLGLKVSFKDIKERAVRPLIAVIITSILLSVVTLYIAATFWN
jgi:uncharacterized integral membrane protein (TIGR00698 family)